MAVSRSYSVYHYQITKVAGETYTEEIRVIGGIYPDGLDQWFLTLGSRPKEEWRIQSLE